MFSFAFFLKHELFFLKRVVSSVALSNPCVLQVVSQLFNLQQWKRLLVAFLKASSNAKGKIEAALEKQSGTIESKQADNSSSSGDAGRDWGGLKVKWADFEQRIQRFKANLPRIEHGFAFAFVDGLLVEVLGFLQELGVPVQPDLFLRDVSRNVRVPLSIILLGGSSCFLCWEL